MICSHFPSPSHDCTLFSASLGHSYLPYVQHQAQQKVETPLLPPQPNADSPDYVRPASPLMETHAKRVRRKLAFDVNIKTKSSAIKHNMATVETTLRSKRAVSNLANSLYLCGLLYVYVYLTVTLHQFHQFHSCSSAILCHPE